MVGCPGCGSKLVFDIASQQMKCSYCGNLYLISQVSKRIKNADEHTESTDEPIIPQNLEEMLDLQTNGMEVTVFTCSQCGAEILADSDEAVTWCSYCGSPATLHSRLTRIRRPDRVIPFKITKEECVNRYRKLARRQIYAPNELLKRGRAEGFRGIYMPFWTYEFDRDGNFRFPGENQEIVGDDLITTRYLVNGRMAAKHSGISHDASLSFDDEVSEHIIPFHQTDCVGFNECYLNGFYANAADQTAECNVNRALSIEEELVFDYVNKAHPDIAFKKNECKAQLSDRSAFRIEMTNTLDMYPVWFLSYRHKDRVSYGTVNGQTGKVYADFPASPVKYVLFSLLTAVPVFLLLNLMMAASPSFVLFVSLFAALLVSGMYKSETEEIFRRQTHMVYSGKDPKEIAKKIGNYFLSGIVFVPFLIGALMGGATEIFPLISTRVVYSVIGVIVSILFAVRFFRMKGRYMALSDLHINLVNGLFLGIGVIATLLFLVKPPNDWYYYAIAYLAALTVALSVIGLIKNYNILSSVRPKQFNRTGGDDNA